MGGALTMFVFLHLNAAVVNALDAAQATHLLVDTQILESTVLCYVILSDVMFNYHVFSD